MLPGASGQNLLGSIVLPYLFEHIWDMQATMLQPVGGMDRIAHAIYEQVKPAVRLRDPGHAPFAASATAFGSSMGRASR